MSSTFKPYSFAVIGFCALLAGACGDDEKQGGLVDSSGDPATGDMDSGPQDSGPEETPADDLPEDPVDAGNGGVLPPAPKSDAGISKAMPGTLLDLPYTGEQLSLCYDAKDCKGAKLGCYASFGTIPGFCSATCETDKDCSPIGGLPASCSPEKLCRVDCSGKNNKGDGPCPTNMACRDLFDPSAAFAGEEGEPGLYSIWRCAYPIHGGSNQVEAYQKCDLEHGSGDCEGELLCHAPSSALGRPANPGYCAQACDSKTKCTAPSGASAVPTCGEGACELDCGAAGSTCPSGMNCRPVGLSSSQVYRCRFIDGKTTP